MIFYLRNRLLLASRRLLDLHFFGAPILILLIGDLGRAPSRVSRLKMLVLVDHLVMVFNKSVTHPYSFVRIGDVSRQLFHGNLGRVELWALNPWNNLLLLLLCHG